MQPWKDLEEGLTMSSIQYSRGRTHNKHDTVKIPRLHTTKRILRRQERLRSDKRKRMVRW